MPYTAMFLCVFLHGRNEDISKRVVILCFFAVSKGGNIEKCNVFDCFLGKVGRWAVEGGECRKVQCF